MKVVLADDETLARTRLRDLLTDIDPSILIVGEAQDGNDTLRQVRTTQPDVVLLDISMPRLNGIEVAREIACFENPPAIIFITAYDEYAIQAFEVSAIDYLLKPVRTERLASALSKAQRFTRPVWKTLVEAMPAEKRLIRTHLYVYRQGEWRLIPVSSVIYLQAEAKYTTVRIAEGEALLETSLSTLEQELGEAFLRIHRKSLVATSRIVGLTSYPKGGMALRLSDVPELLEVSRRHLPIVRAWLRKQTVVRESH